MPAINKPRAAQISNWIGFVRPHLATYDALDLGERTKYVAKLTQATKQIRGGSGSSENTVRRWIAAARFLTTHGVIEIATTTRPAVATVEEVARAFRRDVSLGRQMLQELLDGKATIREFRSRRSNSATLTKPADLPAIAGSLGLRLANFDPLRQGDHADEFRIMNRAAWPAGEGRTADGKTLIAFDENLILWKTSPSVAIDALLSNMVIASAKADLVVVHCPSLKHRVESEVDKLNEPNRGRILVSAQAEREAA